MKYNKYDEYLDFLYTFSSLSQTTQEVYKGWIAKCADYHKKKHPLDLSPDDLESYRLYLLDDRNFSPASDVIIYNAIKHTYQGLLSQVEPEQSKKYDRLFKRPPRQPHRLPRSISWDDMNEFLELLPHTVAGNIIRAIYTTSRRFEDLRDNGNVKWTCSKAYAQQVCAFTARKVGIPHGFGLTGVRATSIIHRIQARNNDLELSQIQTDSGLSDTQFKLYYRAALTAKPI